MVWWATVFSGWYGIILAVGTVCPASSVAAFHGLVEATFFGLGAYAFFSFDFGSVRACAVWHMFYFYVFAV